MRFETRAMQPMYDMRHHTEEKKRRRRVEQLAMVERTEKKKIRVGIYANPCVCTIVRAK